MNLKPLALLTLALALSGCSSSPSNVEETDTARDRALIQYENCLKYYIEGQNRLTKTFENPRVLGSVFTTYQYENSLSYSQILDACVDYRP